MANWGAAQAKAKFSEVLDKAEEQGPQHIQRRKARFILLTEKQYAASKASVMEERPSVDAWDAMRPSFSERMT